ncbi:MAG: cytochrome C oxidase subunit IV family protein [Planctomycetes bacterium]|nr:cytochrome C oxidase subunit IV family protein [Planctomycetota bacterium]
MADTHEPVAHAGPDFRLYLIIFAALSVFTLLSFLVNALFGAGNHTGATIIMLVAVIKATLVAMIFMHLRWDWGRLYFLIIPAFILGSMLMMVLLPDIVLAWV